MDCRPPGSSVPGISQARILEWVAISFSRGSSWPRDWIQVSHIAGRRFNLWATGESSLGGWGQRTVQIIIYQSTKSHLWLLCLQSVQFSSLVVSHCLRPHESQHARPPCPSPALGVHSNSCQSSLWCHPTISSFVVPFSSCLQSLPASESFPMSQLFAWGGQSTGASALASFLPKKSQGWSPSEWTGWISL